MGYSSDHDKSLDVLIVGGQCTYKDGAVFSEFPDHTAFMLHAIETTSLINKYGYGLCVFSGAATKRETPELSEAESFVNILRDHAYLESFPMPYVLDTLALDSPENIILGLMAARSWLISQGKEEFNIRKIGYSSAFSFKGWRAIQNAKGLGVLPFFRFHGFSHDTVFPVTEQYLRPSEVGLLDEEFLLRNKPAYSSKRKKRWAQASTPYHKRFERLQEQFPSVINALHNLDLHGGQSALSSFRSVFLQQIIGSYRIAEAERISGCRV